MSIAIMAEMQGAWPALAAVSVPGAALGWWCAGFATRYSCVLDPFSFYPGGIRSPSRERTLACGAAVLMAILVCLLERRHGLTPAFAATVLALALLLVLAIVDANTFLLPDALTLPLLWLGLLLAWLGGEISLHDAVAGAMAGYGFLFALFWVFKCIRKQEGMGYGDFKLTAALGAWVGPGQLPFVLLAACLLGIAFAAGRHKSRFLTAAYPFGPFLAIGGITVMVFMPGVQSYFW